MKTKILIKLMNLSRKKFKQIKKKELTIPLKAVLSEHRLYLDIVKTNREHGHFYSDVRRLMFTG